MELTRNKTIDGLLTGSPGPFRIETSEERGQRVLNGLRETVAKSEAEAEFALDKEYWVRYYLEGHSEAYGFEIAGDLDREMRGRRGDYRVIYEEQDMVLEVEKDLKNFFEHGHETEGAVGWDAPGSIDLVFAVTDNDDRKEEFDIPVIIAADYDRSELEEPTFGQWYNRVRELKSVKEAFVMSLLSAVYWEYTKGIPTVWEVQKRAGEIDSTSREYLSAIHENLWTAVANGVNDVLFNREVAIQEGEEFADLKSKAMSLVQDGYSETSDWECPNCSEPFVLVGTHKRVYEPDFETMTEGQWAEQQAAQEGGFFEEGVHGETLTAMYCFDCLIGGVASALDAEPMLFDNRTEVEFK
ncbi:hypothetical protein QA599_01940 [Haloarculaceae archaeon H-GB1-1]|nr:hypothetical protein [Haloarculaceae archaeon H-GB1-1]